MGTIATLERGDKFHVPVGMRHQMYALEDTELFEFSTEHFDSDSIRVILEILFDSFEFIITPFFFSTSISLILSF